jgi:hypothetical protein
LRSIAKWLHRRNLKNPFRRFLLKKLKKMILKQSSPSRHKQEKRKPNPKKKSQLKKIPMRLKILKNKKKA